jgi:diguanylate cyclase (GGDEF)-like protein/PAS domain S-box-containing protein
MSATETARARPQPTAAPLRLVVVDDNPDDRALVCLALRKDYPHLEIDEVIDRGGLERVLEKGDFDLVITDFQLRWSDGLQVLRAVKARDPERPVIMFTGTGSEEIAVEAMKTGLDDYVLKSPRHHVRLAASVRTSLERARERRALRENEEALRSLKKAVDSLTIGVTIVDTRGRIVYTNPAEARMHGYSVEELIGREARMLVPPDLWRPMTLEEIRGLRPWKRERSNRRKDGTAFAVQLVSDVVRTPSGDPVGLVTTCEDITERKWVEDQLRRNAFRDPLTGLANRALFMDHLERAVERARRRPDFVYAVLFLDLDRFKLVNDSLGHSVGDRLLVQAARRLEGCVRPGDTVARLGGDEFAILAEEIRNVGDAVQIAHRIHRALNPPHHLDGHDVFATASIGIALGIRSYDQPEAVLRDADVAMYRAKARGKARHEVFDDEMAGDSRDVLRLETDLRRAVDRQEFRMHFQPIVSMASGKTVGAEALVRWQHPERGLLLPEEFIPLAEETGLISPLGEWVLGEACAHGQAWHGAGLAGLRISVNVSPRQFREGNLPALLHRVLQATRIDPALLTIELTESALLENLEESVRSVHELKALGLKISLDDFGTGYSSLSYLRRFPVDSLKIDQSFVQNVTTDPRDAAIATSVIALAHSLKLTVIAEGVETRDQLAFLREARCDEMQGFVFSKAVLPEAFEQIVRGNGSSPG